MSGTSAFRTGRVRVPVVDDEPTLTAVLFVAATETVRRPCRAADGHSAPMIHAVPGTGYTLRSAEDGR